MSQSEFQPTRKAGRKIENLKLSSPMLDLVQLAIDEKVPSMAVAWTAPDGTEVVCIAVVSDVDGAVSALRAYEHGRDAFALKTANKVVQHISEHGMPEKMNVVLHS